MAYIISVLLLQLQYKLYIIINSYESALNNYEKIY